MLRLLVAALVAANLAFYAWTAGWLPPSWLGPGPGDAGQREPGRLQRQLRPQAIEIVPADQLGQLAGLRCVQAGPLAATDRQAVEQALSGLAELSWRWVAAADGERHWLRLDAVTEAQRRQLAGLAEGLEGRFRLTDCP